jgi:hypothetical protein
VCAAGCGSSSTSITGPTGSKCSVTVSSSSPNVAASGGAGTLTVSTSRDCTWAASSSNEWIALTSASSGQGDGSVAYRVAANVDHVARRGTLEVNDQHVEIAQDAAVCQFTLDAISAAAPTAGGTVAVRITSDGSCAWSAETTANWIAIAAPRSGTGSGSVTLNVAANSGNARSASVMIAGQTFTVAQPASTPECTAAVAPSGQNVAAAGGSGSFALTVGSSCSWTTSSSADWVAFTSASSGNGSTSIGFSVAANPAPASRRATIAVAGQTFTINQDGLACAYTVSPLSQTVAAIGGSVNISVTAGPACGWSATSDVGWIAVASGASGSGNGTVALRIDPTSGGSRSGTASIAGQTVTITQGAQSCSYSINPGTQALAAAGGRGSVAVSAGGSCAWTATTNDKWISITSGSSGTGDGTVAYSVSANSGGARTGTVSIAGQTFTINQASQSCSYAISASNQSIGSAGGTGSVGVTAGGACSWTATSNDGWITVTSGASGTGNGTVAYSVASNAGAARTGTLTIAGQTFTVSQATQTCSYAIAPQGQGVGAGGGSGTVAVTAGSSCSWTAAAVDNWITVTSGSSGTGNGTVAYSAAPNPGTARSGTMTIAGQTFTVTQAAQTCAYAINPASTSTSAGGGAPSVTVTAGAGCTWTSTSNAPWIAVTSGASGAGNGTVGLTIAANSGMARTGTVTIAGQTFSVSQAAPCSFAIAPMGQNFDSSGGSGTVTVTADAGCAWTAASNAPWITITSGANGTGSGMVGFAVAPNAGPDQTGTLTIAGQTFTVVQGHDDEMRRRGARLPRT